MLKVEKPWEDRVSGWGSDRNLIEGSTPAHQLGKLLEECGELAAAIANKNGDDATDAIGDISVVLCVIANQLGLRYSECQEAAWEEIKDRKGRMVDGVFVKEG
jgi:NTP pyrophosphatase (non-canonical NTP hydrolase)